jgi:hypothetical protein
VSDERDYSKPKRRYTMGDSERAYRGFRDRDTAQLEAMRVDEDAPTPERGVQGHDGTPHDVSDDRTPYPVDLMNMLAEDPRLDRLARKLWAHASNTELRTTAKMELSDGAQISTQLDELKARMDETIGVKNDNGRFGKLKGRVQLIWVGLGFVLVTAVGSIGVAISASNAAGERDGRNEARIEQLRHDIDRIADQVQQLWTFQFRAPLAPGVHP